MAGLTPFQFSSNKLQNARAIGALGNPASNSTLLGGNSLLGNTTSTITSWYEMWINPLKIKFSTPFLQNVEQTAGSIVTYHYRKDLTILTVSGAVGWLAIKSQLEELQDMMFKGLTQGVKNVVKGNGFKQNAASVSKANTIMFGSGPKSTKDKIKQLALGAQDGSSNRLNNSPKQFLQRLKDLADEPSYYYDSDGIEHYNPKFIKMYTQQYPNGVICEGYFKEFNIPEDSEDPQTVFYDFAFAIENIKPVTIIQRVAGMFSGGVGNVIGGGIGMF